MSYACMRGGMLSLLRPESLLVSPTPLSCFVLRFGFSAERKKGEYGAYECHD